MKVAPWQPPRVTPEQAAAAETELRDRANVIDQLVAEIRADAAQARKTAGDSINTHSAAVDGELRRVLGVVAHARRPEQLVLLRHAAAYFADLKRQWQADYDASVKRGFDRNLASQVESMRAGQRLAWQERQGAAIIAPVSALVDRLIALRGRLAPDNVGEWHQMLEDALDSCRGSVAAALHVSDDGNVSIKEAA